MSIRIYTFEVEIEDEGVHERYDDGTCDHQASVSCEDSITRKLDDMGYAMARKAATSSLRTFDDTHAIEKVGFIESFSEKDWDDMIYRPIRAR